MKEIKRKSEQKGYTKNQKWYIENKITKFYNLL